MSIIHDNYRHEVINFKDYEKEWIDYLETHSQEELLECVEKTYDWRFFYFFSPMRESILKWYDFDEEATVLEIGAGYGSLTGLLCDKCKKVVVLEKYREKAFVIKSRYKKRTNLDIYVGTLKDCVKEKFDYIVFNGSFGYQCNGSKHNIDYVNYLRELKQYITETSKILIIAENRLGVEYLCGKPAPSTGLPFDTLSNYDNNCKYHSFTLYELREIINQAGFSYCKYYYPFPDYMFAQEIYTDEFRPSEKVMERVLNYHTYQSTAIADEDLLLQDFIKMGAFQYVANSFIIEMSQQSNLGDTIYASCTADRGEAYGSITVIHEGDRVTKRSLCKGNQNYIKVVYDNLEKLRNRGIPVIEQTLSGNSIEMPRIFSPTLSEYLTASKNLTANKVYEIFDQLYDYILKSSPHTDRCDFQRISQNDYVGPVLEHAFIDMIPFNCFILDTNEFMFFDQEFVRDNYPAGYIMYRALMYSYLFSKNLNELVPLETMKCRYNLMKQWDAYAEEEQKFVSENRRYNRNPLFWENTKKKYINEINNNRMRLLHSQPAKIIIENTVEEESNKEYELGYIAGVFDLFHVGHLNLLKRAKEKCKTLLVGVLSDELVEKFKGKKPYIPVGERMQIIESSKYVDLVVMVDSSNIDKVDAWNLYHFDCLFSGDDWKDSPQWNIDQKKLKALGSNIYFFEYTKSTSSTQIKKLINEGRL